MRAQAGSDSLLTSATFLKLADTFFSGLEGLRRWVTGLVCLRAVVAQRQVPPQHCMLGSGQRLTSTLVLPILCSHRGVLYGLGADGNNELLGAGD